MKDFLENLEDAAERQYYESTKGLQIGQYRCGCGRVTDDNDMNFISMNPYAMPVCGFCLEEWRISRVK